MTRYPALIALIAGAVAACGFAPLDLWPLSIAGLIVLLALVQDAPNIRGALWRGWAFGVGHFTVNNNWFQHAFDFQDKMPPVLGYFAAVGLALYLAIFPMAAAGVAWRFRGKRRDAAPDAAYVLIFGAAWIATEYLRARLFTGYAWDPLSVVWLPVIGVARVSALVGTYALSGLTVVLAGAIWLAMLRRWHLAAVMVPACGIAALSAPLTRAPDPAPDAPLVRVVQPNVAQDQRGESDGPILLERLIALSGRPGARPRLVLWPEGVVRDMIEDGYPDWAYFGFNYAPPFWDRRRIASVLGPRDTALVGGTALNFSPDRRQVTSAANSVFAISSQARIIGRYDKAHLVPYGEYLPMPWLLKPLGLARLVPGDMDFSAGPGPRNLRIPGFGPVGVQLCYEIIFSGQVVDRAHRPRLLFNPSNDAWFGRWGPPQHLAQARMRAIEEGLPILRATPNGISAIIAADGRLVATVPHLTAGAAEAPLPVALAPTLFSRIGNIMALAIAMALAAIAVAIRRRGR
ncbi:apolipoprotein N-acyltransferase [Sphingomonas sp. SORGH_AS_0879]|uniref:apolipoprotein N-acyltransferase n=1 Tax=Sphingomonas sp. SORGH_AS_0879 TaxID=3041790 RepID=UPI00278A07B3|nr:apolipoprotein N-acyltransferase [Sphingomonas sp. SORGH_AS_0879]MDQ1229616.1 apolipoprotein N-acyltransferase [Sphingomonas sp. SORGH_AS_0879]